MEFHTALKKTMEYIGIRDLKSKQFESRESSGRDTFVPFSLCCLINASDLDRFRQCSYILVLIPTMKITVIRAA